MLTIKMPKLQFAIKVPNACHSNTWCFLVDYFSCPYQLMFGGGKICIIANNRNCPINLSCGKAFASLSVFFPDFCFLLLFVKK